MKKILFFSALALIFASCSSDDNSTSEEDTSILPKTISFIFPNEQLGTNSTGTLVYNGNKIVSLTREHLKVVYTYEGNMITKQQQFDLDLQGNEEKSKEVVYTYENGKLKTRVFKEGFSDNNSEALSIDKNVYTYVSNSLVSYINYSASNIKQGEGSLELKDGNIIKEIRNFGTSKSTTTYEYDTKFNVLRNVLGFDLLFNEIDGFGKNNITKTTRISTEFPNPAVYLKSYMYNENGYPTKTTLYDNSGTSIEYEIKYTY
ncbi:hypothetical protein SAMN05444671_0246 [Flavobacterium sp. CF108]|uniref:hypothetical protein n=1 Tax=unclassified Flavobacterium TaxID=196869 RepID=UPI0008AD8DC3|nr:MULTISPECIES: hypothetical protein [unclassified Flavobacterium]SEP22528.1 hypothetical protein SAMN04487978_0103 [Flavobacterium sp. fv08]SHI07874.1 hypothetical protein SAMN05444671_0246 [Flavobacterium sp. CF108]